MLSWLRSLFGHSPDRDRVIFRYWDGTRTKSADPLRLKAALDKACPEWAAKCDKLAQAVKVSVAGLPIKGGLAAELSKQREALTQDLIKASREAFDLKPFADSEPKPIGATDLEAFGVLAEFLGWIGDVMEDTRPFQTPPPSTESAAEPSPTASESASPSTPTESSATASEPSAGASAAPSPPAPIKPDESLFTSHP